MTRSTYIIAIISIALACLWPELSHGLNIQLEVEERSGVNRINEPVSSGIPFSKEANIKSISLLGVFDSSGNQIPAQFRVLSRYNGTPSDVSKPIRVVLADFYASVSSDQKAIFFLKNSGSGTVSGENIASETASHIIINSGNLIAKISKINFNLFDEIIVNGKNIISPNSDDGIITVFNGKEYGSYNNPTMAVIEENGPLRCVVKIQGYLKDKQGNKLMPPLGDNGISYTVRINAFKNKSYMKVDFTLENENKGWTHLYSEPVHNIDITSCFLKTTLNNLDNKKIIAFADYIDNFDSGNYELKQTETSDGTNQSYIWSYSIKKNGTIVKTGTQYDSFANLQDASKGLMVASRWFWQNHPIGINFTDNALHFYLWPGIGQAHRILGGIWKTHELLYYFHKNESNFDDKIAKLKKRLVAKCTDNYYAETNFFTPLVPKNFTSNYTFPAGEPLQAAINQYNEAHQAKFDSSFIKNNSTTHTIFNLRSNRKIKLTDSQYTTWYGWLEFGNTPRGNNYGYSAQHYDWSYVSLLGFLRFGNYSMLAIGEQFVNHKADIIVIHDPYADSGIDYEYHGGQRYENDALMSYHYDYGAYNTGPRKASHFWTKGMTLQYLLTGDERYKSSVEQCFDHVARVKDYPPMTNIETRNQTRGIDALVNGYLLTGKDNYLSDAFHIFNQHLLPREGDDGSEKGWIHSHSSNPYGVWIGYDTIMVEPLVRLFTVLQDAGKDNNADKLKAFLIRWANWVKNTVYPSWHETCGSYRNNNTEYFPYTVRLGWDANSGSFSDHHTDGQFSMTYADLFSLIYKETNEESWLNLARNVFKDYHIYNGGYGEWQNVKDSNNETSALLTGAAYLKIGKAITRSLYYLRTEWEYSQIETPPELPIEKPSAPTGLHIQ